MSQFWIDKANEHRNRRKDDVTPPPITRAYYMTRLPDESSPGWCIRLHTKPAKFMYDEQDFRRYFLTEVVS